MRVQRNGHAVLPRVKGGMCVLAVLGAVGAPGGAWAFEVDTEDPDLRVRWDNTFKYSAAWRVTGQDGRITGPFGANANDADRNFNRGLISNRIDWLSEFDISYRNQIGARLSGAAWYDSVYNRGTDNASAGPAQNIFPPNEFPNATSRLHGRKAEFLDAFLFANLPLGDRTANLRVGRYTLLYGESLFFGGNGIAAAQTPIDVIKAVSVPSSQFKEIALPVGQASGQVQITPQVTAGAYYQYEWRQYRLPGAGSYFGTDFFDAGGTQFLQGPFARQRAADVEAKDSGQWGAQLRVRPTGSDIEYGLYYARFHAKTPTVNLNPILNTYYLLYQKDIETYGASLATTVGETSVSAEVSVRRDTPLLPFGVVNVVPDPVNACRNNGDQTCVPLGNSAHAQVSWITVFPGTALWEGASFVGELAFNRRTSITKNSAAVDPNATRDAWGVRVVFTPSYFEVLPQMDVAVPIGVGYAISGRSSVFSFGPEHGGDASVGLDIDYQKTWRAGLKYTHFFGRKGGAATTNTKGGPSPVMASFDQTLGDRNFVSFSLQRTF